MESKLDTTNIGRKWNRLLKGNQIGMVLMISVGLFILNVIINPKSFNVNAFGSIFALASMLTIASAGQTLVVISDGIDMSVGATMSMTALITVGVMGGHEGRLLIALFYSVVVGLIIGLCNGIGTSTIGLPPMIVTMSIANVVTRLQYVFTQGKPTGTASKLFTATLQYRVLGVFPTVILYALAYFGIVFYILNRTRFGQQLFLTGNNSRAAYLTGIKTTKIRILTYAIAGILSGIAGFLGAGYMNFVMCQAFDTYTMMSIVAVVIGGTLLVGGKGSYIGTAAGALLMIVLSNFLSVLNLPQSIRDIIMGIVLIAILAMYNRSQPIRQ